MRKLKKLLSLILIATFISPTVNIFAEETKSQGNEDIKKYEEVKIGDFQYFSPSYSVDEKPEVKKKLEESKEIKVLKKETTANFEIALAYSDGSYKYVENANTLKEAIDKADKLETKKEELEHHEGEIIPTVINAGGQAVYSTNSMGRIWKHRDGKPEASNNYLTYIYSNPELSKQFTYINQGYIDDVPIIEDIGNAAKVQVNGYNGWVNKNQSSNDYDLVVVPINQVTNPSCYLVKNGFLYHFISNNMTSYEGNGYSIKVGKAPSYLTPGKDYYSYDGVYFYDGNTISEGLNKLITDLKSNTKGRAVNSSSPYYAYYQYLPFRTKTNYTASQLNSYINRNAKANSKLRGLGDVFIESQNKYGVNPLLMLGVAINESAFGTSNIALTKNNLFGIAAYDFSPGESANSFQTPGDSVREFAKNYISRGYADPADWRYFGGYLGNKALGANVKYASDPYWGEKAAQHILDIDFELSGGDLDDLTDYDAYQLATYTGANTVTNQNGELIYNINPTVSGWGGYSGNIVALTYGESNNWGEYEVFPDRTTALDDGGDENKFHGNYDWNNRGFIKTNNVKFINTPSSPFIPGYEKSDVNRNGKTDIEDLSKMAVEYNSTSASRGFKRYLDLNSDGIVDVLDLISISKKL
ncbi:glucosaminidase domain-containing protein [Clostridium septicum]|uniref:Cell wall-binding protein n=1 Tax=Clostridium septicum TaxID=1504 RepID=A0A9N7JKF2_CLOSE|nr:glucosaminidase domain-containing protein [Clostridium septicum]AYE33874.1 cell wall-binding protein [Clostridium septicum]MDU1314093.1 glucosaminidase domain-containing protein [Clostridium septicum]QAS62016.1 cell wall-binding protein [Clostridium septicum]UEC21518.1 glucosaminidase domain-containing protein [Clostridium septicum]USS00435.1 glucosaminidase domain-containing protein [Clostridium septicum]